MKKTVLLLCCVLMLHLISLSCASQSLAWHLKNPERKSLGIKALFKSSSDLIASSGSGGLFVSSNGQKWRHLGGLGSVADCVAEHFNMLFVSSGGMIHRSTDSGQTWDLHSKPAGRLSGQAYSIQRIGNRLFAHFGAYGICQSLDSGRTWNSVNGSFDFVINGSGDTVMQVENFLATNTRLYAVTRDYWSRTHGTYISNDYGASWQFARTYPSQLMTSLSGYPVLAMGGDVGLYDQSDGILAKDVLHTSYRFNAIAVDANAIYAYADSTDVLVRSFNRGLTWDTIHTGLKNPPGKYGVKLLASGQQLWLAFSAGVLLDHAIYRSDDRGQTWQSSDDGIYSLFFSRGSTCADELILSGDSVFAVSTDGTAWTPIKGTSKGDYVRGTRDGHLYRVSNDSLYVTTDKGVRWSYVSSYKDTSLPKSASALQGRSDVLGQALALDSTLILCQYTGVYEVSTSGYKCLYRRPLDYSKVLNVHTTYFQGLAWRYRDTYMAILPGFKPVDTACVILSSNNLGSSWNPLGSWDPAKRIDAAGATDSAIFICTQKQELYRSLNGGMSFEKVLAPWTNADNPRQVYRFGNVIFIRTELSLYVSNGRGEVWVKAGREFEYAASKFIEGTKQRVFVGVPNAGIYSADLSTVDIESEYKTIVSRSFMMFPNPSSGKVTIRTFPGTVPTVGVRVSNMVGDQVLTLSTDTPGEQDEFSLSCDTLPSGVYRVSLIDIHGRTTSSEQLVILR